MMYFVSKPYQNVLDKSVDTPGHRKTVVGGFNSVHKRYLATCLRMISTPKVDKIDDSKRIRFYAIT